MHISPNDLFSMLPTWTWIYGIDWTCWYQQTYRKKTWPFNQRGKGPISLPWLKRRCVYFICSRGHMGSRGSLMGPAGLITVWLTQIHCKLSSQIRSVDPSIQTWSTQWPRSEGPDSSCSSIVRDFNRLSSTPLWEKIEGMVFWCG